MTNIIINDDTNNMNQKKTFSPITISCFKAYDIRGELDVNLDTDIAYRVGRAFAEFLGAKKVVIGCDIRQSSEEIKTATIAGIIDAGCDVIDLGMTGTEEVYFYTSHYQADGGIEVTASHNPINFNGLKLVREQSKPIGKTSGLADIKAIAESGNFAEVTQIGTHHLKNDKSALVEHLLTYIDIPSLKPLKLVINPGNGSAAPLVDAIEQKLIEANAPIELIKMHYEPDGNFPHGIPNPMIEANRIATSQQVIDTGADIGIAFDGDFDRCFFFDETGQFIEGYYIVGLLTQAFLQKEPEANQNTEQQSTQENSQKVQQKIVYDPRVIWNTENIIEQHNGIAVMSQSGHSNIKAIMREQNAIYGGEMSAHHYFRDFNYCDSGMIPWLLITELLSKTGKTLSSLVSARIDAYPSSGEKNFRLSDIEAPQVMQALQTFYDEKQTPYDITHIDGLSMAFSDWRFNLRASNTEPLIRLNVETKHNNPLLTEKLSELQKFLLNLGATPA